MTTVQETAERLLPEYLAWVKAQGRRRTWASVLEFVTLQMPELTGEDEEHLAEVICGLVRRDTP